MHDLHLHIIPCNDGIHKRERERERESWLGKVLTQLGSIDPWRQTHSFGPQIQESAFHYKVSNLSTRVVLWTLSTQREKFIFNRQDEKSWGNHEWHGPMVFLPSPLLYREITWLQDHLLRCLSCMHSETTEHANMKWHHHRQRKDVRDYKTTHTWLSICLMRHHRSNQRRRFINNYYHNNHIVVHLAAFTSNYFSTFDLRVVCGDSGSLPRHFLSV